MSAALRLEGRVAIVTGGSRGIGFGIADAFAAAGADLLIAATNKEKLEEARSKLSEHGRRVEIAVVDVSDRSQCFALVEQATDTFGKLDIVVNCAAIYTPRRFLDYTPEDFERLLSVNLHGPFHITQAALPGMLKQGSGRIINIASTAGKWGSRNQAIYNIAKHGVVGMTRCVALETAGSGVTVNAICPGLVKTDLLDQFLKEHADLNGVSEQAVYADLMKRQPIGRFLDIGECGHLAVYLASDEAAGMTGQSLLLDGGMLFV